MQREIEKFMEAASTGGMGFRHGVERVDEYGDWYYEDVYSRQY